MRAYVRMMGAPPWRITHQEVNTMSNADLVGILAILALLLILGLYAFRKFRA